MEKCQKCSGVLLEMKSKKTMVPGAEKTIRLKCSRCGFYLEKHQTFSGNNRYDELANDYPYLRRRDQAS